MRRTIDFEANLVSSTCSNPQLVDHLTATSTKNFTGIKFLRDSADVSSNTWPGSRASGLNETKAIEVCTRDWVESCIGDWLGKGFDSDLNNRQMELMKVKNQNLPFNKPRSWGGYNRVWRARVAKLAIQDIMARKLQACYRFYDVKKRMRLGGEFNVQKALECFQDEHFDEAVHCLKTAESFFRIQRNKEMLTHADELRTHIQVVQRGEEQMARARACLTAENPPLEIVRATLEVAEQLFLEVVDKTEDDYGRLNEVHFLRADTDIQSAIKLLAQSGDGQNDDVDLALARERLDEAEKSLGTVKLELMTHEEKTEKDKMQEREDAQAGTKSDTNNKNNKNKNNNNNNNNNNSTRGVVKSRDHFMKSAENLQRSVDAKARYEFLVTHTCTHTCTPAHTH
jgi:hypothetical protein